MEENPYSAFIGAIRKETENIMPAIFRTGIVANEDPLAVDIGGALQGRTSLVYATPSPFVAVEVDPTTLQYNDLPAGEGPHTHPGVTEDHIHTARVTNLLPIFKRGENLLLIPIEEEQRYIVLARLVGL